MQMIYKNIIVLIMVMPKLLQSDIDSVQKLCFENCMIFNVGKTAIASFTRKTFLINFNYKLFNNIILRSQ
jgi:hypothetical protein